MEKDTYRRDRGLVEELMERYDARDVAKDDAAFSDELVDVLFLAFKAGSRPPKTEIGPLGNMVGASGASRPSDAL